MLSAARVPLLHKPSCERPPEVADLWCRVESSRGRATSGNEQRPFQQFSERRQAFPDGVAFGEKRDRRMPPLQPRLWRGHSAAIRAERVGPVDPRRIVMKGLFINTLV